MQCHRQSSTTTVAGESKEDESSTDVNAEKPGEGEQVRYYLDQGIDFNGLTRRMGFSETTVRREVAKRIRQEKEKVDTGQVGSGSVPMVTKDKEVINPEAILQHYLANGSLDWRLRVEGMMLLRAAQRMNLDDVRLVQGLAEAQAEVTKSQLSIFKEAIKGESAEVAREAAAEVARQLIPTLESEMQSLRAQIPGASPPDPVTRMVNFMQGIPRMMQASQQLMEMMGMPVQGSSPQGMQLPVQQPDAQSPGSGPAQQLGVSQQPGFQQLTEEEIREVFGD